MNLTGHASFMVNNSNNGTVWVKISSYRLSQHDVHFLKMPSVGDVVPKWNYYSSWRPMSQIFYSILNHLRKKIDWQFADWPCINLKRPRETHRKTKRSHQLPQPKNRHIVQILLFLLWLATVLRMVLIQFYQRFHLNKEFWNMNETFPDSSKNSVEPRRSL